MAARFGGRLTTATFTKIAIGAYNASDPSGTPAQTSIQYSGDAIAFGYKGMFVNGELVTKADARVVILIGTVRTVTVDPEDSVLAAVVPAPGDAITWVPPGQSASQAGRVVEVKPFTHAAITVSVKGLGA